MWFPFSLNILKNNEAPLSCTAYSPKIRLARQQRSLDRWQSGYGHTRGVMHMVKQKPMISVFVPEWWKRMHKHLRMNQID